MIGRANLQKTKKNGDYQCSSVPGGPNIKYCHYFQTYWLKSIARNEHMEEKINEISAINSIFAYRSDDCPINKKAKEILKATEMNFWRWSSAKCRSLKI